MTKQAQIAALVLAVGLVAAAQDSSSRIYRSGSAWIEETTGTLPATRMLKIKTVVGAIHVAGGQQGSITYTIRRQVHASSEDGARREFARIRVSTSSSGDTSTIRGEESSGRGSLDIDVHVSSQVSVVRAKTGCGQIGVKGISGTVEVSTGGDTIRLDDISGDVRASSGGGSIEVGKIGGNVHVNTGGGDIRVQSSGGQVVAISGGGSLFVGTANSMTLETAGGSIKVDRCSGDVKASTGGGTVELTEVGQAQVESGGGSIRIASVHGSLRAETSSGPIVAYLTPNSGAFADSRLETSMGDIVVYIPENLGINIRAAVEAAGKAGISSDFPLKVVFGDQRWGPREAYAEGSVNGGGPLLHVHTSTGSIEFKRKDKERN